MTDFGAWLALGDPWLGVLAHAAGLRWLVIDQQHGRFDDERTRAALDALRGAGAPGWVRVARNDPALIGRALDSGAVGVVVPMIESAEEGAAAVAAASYPPAGRRSFGVLPLVRAAEGPGCALMIETAAALEQVEAIAATGASALFVGPFDLAAALGVGLQDLLDDRRPSAPLPRIVAAARAAGVPVMAFGGSVAAARLLAAHGVDLVALATDAGLVTAGAQEVLARVGDDRPAEPAPSLRSEY